MAHQQSDFMDRMFQNAYAEGRNTLYEHEVYDMLSAIGIDVPECVFVKDIREVSEETLARFKTPFLMIKMVSRDLAHNQRYGGVKKVSGKDPLFIQFVMTRMQEKVLSYFPEGGKPQVDGFLIIEFIKFTQSLGNEIMIGLQDDLAFGSVTMLTKGGDDAEFFAKYYDAANLILSPISYQDAFELSKNLKIKHKYEETGHSDYIDKLAKAVSAISQLGYDYSLISPKLPQFHLKVLDVNPLVFSEDGRFTAVDGYAEFAKVGTESLYNKYPDTANLDKFFKPKGIAIFGVSSDPEKYSMARVIVTLFTDLGRDDVYCVNPKGGSTQIAGRNFPLYTGFEEIPDNVDLIVYAAPAKNTLKFLESIPEDRAIILISGIPPEIDYSEFMRATKNRRAGIRIVGPNCMGVFNAPADGKPGVNTLFINESKLRISHSPASNLALLTQSGAMGISLIERTQHSKIIRSIVSFGNKADVNIPDLLSYFEGEQNIDVISLYIEGINEHEGRQFFELSSKSEKPIIVYKSGRTQAGAKAAASHTASMSGSYDVFKAACGQAGCILTEELDDFYNFTKAFSMLSTKKVQGKRVAGVVNAGLDATMGADTIYFLEQTTFAEATQLKIRELNTQGLVDINTSFLDVTPMTDDIAFAGYVKAAVADENVDCMFVAIVPHIENLKTVESDYMDPDAICVLLANIAKNTNKPIVVSVNTGNHYQHIVAYLEEQGIPVYPNIHAAIRSLDAYVKYFYNKNEAKNI